MEEKPSALSIAALVLAILGCCPCCNCFPAIVGAILGKVELRKIDLGDSSEAGRTFAKIGFILGVVNTLLWLLLILIWIGLTIASGGLSALSIGTLGL
ncbi:MAG TPA: hypothetical protein DIU15_01795 [Deltaproteobacteria bacterium]|nr:hypothetical protein [Deltaproteobacteria bacterium]HCP44752.1 hypothetical protein [Deltaproteobacteria bacterium]|tara:strand:- start:782 stop:1075 length:294 start_codon:yes stop_codon:yes gene_type:complete